MSSEKLKHSLFLVSFTRPPNLGSSVIKMGLYGNQKWPVYQHFSPLLLLFRLFISPETKILSRNGFKLSPIVLLMQAFTIVIHSYHNLSLNASCINFLLCILTKKRYVLSCAIHQSKLLNPKLSKIPATK